MDGIGRSRGRAAIVATLAVLCLLVASCSAPSAGPAAAPDVANGALLDAPTDLSVYPSLQGLTQRSVKIRYRSTSGIDGAPTTVSGTLLVPRGDPPPGGWRIASIGHPTSGLNSSCAPSTRPGLMGTAGEIGAFLSYGYLVVMSDYQGLGTPGPHPYLEPKTAARNVIDAVRAAREAVPEASNRFVAYGVSQGGQAVWAANEAMAEYGVGLDMVGSISIAPPTDLRPLVDAMENGTLTVQQRVLMPTILAGLAVSHPELHVDDYLRGEMRDRMDVFLGCADENSELRGRIASGAPPEDFRPSSRQAADALRRALGEDALPAQRAAAPMLVAYGDEDPVVLPEWTAAAVGRACGLGDVVAVVVAPGQGHGVLDIGAAPAEWTTGRFDGQPPPTACPPA